MAKFAKTSSKTGLHKTSMTDKNFAGDDCDRFKEVEDYIARKTPLWDKKIKEMERRVIPKKIQEDAKGKDVLFDLFTKYKSVIEKLGVYGAIVVGAILMIFVSSCMGGNNAESAPSVTTTTLASPSDNSFQGNIATWFIIGLVLYFFVYPALSSRDRW